MVTPLQLPLSRRAMLQSVVVCWLSQGGSSRAEDVRPADLIVHHAKVVTLDAQNHFFEAVAIQDGHIAAVGDNGTILRRKGPDTRVIDAAGHMVLPGLYDSHAHPISAAISELRKPLPYFRSLLEVFAYIRRKTTTTPEGEWIVIHYAFPTRLDESRFPTRAELDAVAPKHPVLYHAGPAGLVNSMGLKVSGITSTTPSPKGGMIVKDPATGAPTGMLRSAYEVLKGLPPEGGKISDSERREAVRKLFLLYNSRGLTSVADRNAGPADLALYRALGANRELTLRVNVSRQFNPYGSRVEIGRRLEALMGPDGQGGPTGAGDDWVRIGPIKVFLDGGMLNGTAFMRQPWPKGPTYQITEEDYRGLLLIPPAQLGVVAEEAARRRWQLTAHTAGEGAMDVLLDAYDQANRLAPSRICVLAFAMPTSPRCTTWNGVGGWECAPTSSRSGCGRMAPRCRACSARSGCAGFIHTGRGRSIRGSPGAAIT